MPTSHAHQLNEIVELISLTDPRSVLDIGVGFGKYGFLAREYLELWDGRENYTDRERRIDGIEAFEKYITPLQRLLYDEIHIGHAQDILPKLERRYDLVLLIDVIEHLTREDGLALLRQCLRVGRNVVVSTPLDIGDQGEMFENPHERHLYQWRRADFAEFPRIFARNYYSLICYLGESADAVGRKYRAGEFRRRVLRWMPWLRTLRKSLRRPS